MFVLLFVFAFFVATSANINKTSCPTSCSCRPRIEGIVQVLTVDCQGGTHVDRELLSKQLDSLLSSNQTYGHLTQLSINNSPLTHVPRSVCRLTTLTQLHLDNNRLTRLPDNCLTNLTAMPSLSASRNNITELQDGLFDGLGKLQTLQLSYNQILSIGLRVFNGSAMLTSLRNVNVSYNKLEVLEPWPYFVTINVRDTLQQAPIDVSHNNISVFTNRLGLKGVCIRNWNVIFDYNPIRHISDIFHGWNVTITTYVCCATQMLDNFHLGEPSLDYVYLVCDCLDFRIFTVYFVLHNDVLYKVYCRANSVPGIHTAKSFMTIPLDQYVCELTERCPSGCRCVHRPANATLHIYCSNTNLTVLPLELPELPKSYTKYKLDFSNNQFLRRLEHHDYFVNTSILDVSNSDIQPEVSADVWNAILKIPQINLHGNKLTS